MEFFQGARGEDFHDITLMLDGEPIGAHKVRHSCCCHFLCHSVCIIFREIPLGKFVSEKMLNRSLRLRRSFKVLRFPRAASGLKNFRYVKVACGLSRQWGLCHSLGWLVIPQLNCI